MITQFGKRTLSLLLALIMILAAVPFQAPADCLIRAYSALCLLPPEAHDQCMIANMISA